MLNNKFKLVYILLVFTGFSFVTGCSRGPKPIEYGKDLCEHCSMTIMDKKWGAEYVSDKGKVYKFDSIECLLSYYLHNGLSGRTQENSLWTVDFVKGDELINAEKAYYLKSNTLKSPMGLNVASFNTSGDLNKFRNNDDKIVSWVELISMVKAGW